MSITQPIPCPFCKGQMTFDIDPQSVKAYVSCENGICKIKPGISALLYGSRQEMLEKIVVEWNKCFEPEKQTIIEQLRTTYGKSATGLAKHAALEMVKVFEKHIDKIYDKLCDSCKKKVTADD